jgi:hypothetical protein
VTPKQLGEADFGVCQSNLQHALWVSFASTTRFAHFLKRLNCLFLVLRATAKGFIP